MWREGGSPLASLQVQSILPIYLIYEHLPFSPGQTVAMVGGGEDEQSRFEPFTAAIYTLYAYVYALSV